MDYGHLLFKRAYLITDSSLEWSTGRHAGLVQGWKRQKEYGRQNSYFPGAATPYSAVKMLTANTLLDIRDRKVHRYFPRAPLETRRITDGLVDEIARLFSSQIDLLSRDHRLAVSLSGGFDSRTTMAASREHRKDILYFTYGGPQKYEDDALLAAELCRKLDLEHLVIRKEHCGEYLEEFMDVWRVNTSFNRPEADGAIAKAIYESRLRGRLQYRVLESLLPEALEVPFYKDLKPRYVTAAKTFAKHAKYYVDRALTL